MLTSEKYEARLKEIQREQRRAACQRYNETHREERRAYQAKWRAEHPNYSKEYHRAHPTKRKGTNNYDRRRENNTDDT